MLQTKAPIKYLIATSVIKETEAADINWNSKEETNLQTILKVLHFNILQIQLFESANKGTGDNDDVFDSANNSGG